MSDQEPAQEQLLPEGPRVADVLGNPDAWPLFGETSRRWDEGLAVLADRTPPRLYHQSTPIKMAMDRMQLSIRSTERYDYGITPDIYPWLRELAPQALLRDLYRPVRDYSYVSFEYNDMGRVSLRNAYLEMRTGQQPLSAPIIEPLTLVVREEQARRRALMKEPWRAHLPDSAPRQHQEAMHGGVSDLLSGGF